MQQELFKFNKNSIKKTKRDILEGNSHIDYVVQQIQSLLFIHILGPAFAIISNAASGQVDPMACKVLFDIIKLLPL